MMYSHRIVVKSWRGVYDEPDLSNDDNWFGRRLKVLRERAGLAQPRLAEEMGVSVQTVREWERGVKFPHLRKLLPLAEALGVEAGQFFPSTGYAGTWPQEVRDGESASKSCDGKVLAQIDRHLSVALDEFRKIVRNRGL